MRAFKTKAITVTSIEDLVKAINATQRRTIYRPVPKTYTRHPIKHTPKWNNQRKNFTPKSLAVRKAIHRKQYWLFWRGPETLGEIIDIRCMWR